MSDPVIQTLSHLRKKAVEGQHIDLRVDGYGDAYIGVRYGMLQFDVAQPLFVKLQDADTPERRQSANLDLLVNACKGVFMLVDGRQVGVDASHPDVWPRFDADLAKVLDMAGPEDRSTRDVCGELFVKPLQVGAHAAKVLEFWGLTDVEVYTKLAGE